MPAAGAGTNPDVPAAEAVAPFITAYVVFSFGGVYPSAFITLSLVSSPLIVCDDLFSTLPNPISSFECVCPLSLLSPNRVLILLMMYTAPVRFKYLFSIVLLSVI